MADNSTRRSERHQRHMPVRYFIMCSTGGKTRRTYFTLDGPGIKFRWSTDVPCPSGPAPGFIQPPVQLVQGLFSVGKAARAWRWPPNTHVAVRLKNTPIPLLPVWVFTACSTVNFTFYLLRTSQTQSNAAHPTSHQCEPGALSPGTRS
jgi:hypothetical protein